MSASHGAGAAIPGPSLFERADVTDATDPAKISPQNGPSRSGRVVGWLRAQPLAPLATACLIFLFFAMVVPRYLTGINLRQLMRDFAEPGLVAAAMAVTVLSGGIDLSVGAIFALANLIALLLFRVAEASLAITIAAVLGTGMLIGALNGVLVAYLRLKPFITTLAVLIILRAVYDLASQAYTTELAIAMHDSATWRFLGAGLFAGVPVNMVCLVAVAVGMHVFLTRVRPGLHIVAAGASQKAARHAGINVARTLVLAYTLSGLLAALAGIFYAARQNGAGSDTGLGWEVTALTGVVLGGISLAGGRGTILNGIIGSAITFLLVGGLLRLNLPGSLTAAITGLVLLSAMGASILAARFWATGRTAPPVDAGRGT